LVCSKYVIVFGLLVETQMFERGEGHVEATTLPLASTDAIVGRSTKVKPLRRIQYLDAINPIGRTSTRFFNQNHLMWGEGA
jgi:hypothetical protein